jgi:hypothetical protein
LPESDERADLVAGDQCHDRQRRGDDREGGQYDIREPPARSRSPKRVVAMARSDRNRAPTTRPTRSGADLTGDRRRREPH